MNSPPVSCVPTSCVRPEHSTTRNGWPLDGFETASKQQRLSVGRPARIGVEEAAGRQRLAGREVSQPGRRCGKRPQTRLALALDREQLAAIGVEAEVDEVLRRSQAPGLAGPRAGEWVH